MTRAPIHPDRPDAEEDGRLRAPATARNMGPILDVLLSHAPREGRALEIAAGTGEHAVAFARAFPGLDWQPSDIDETRLASIAAWARAEGPETLRAPIHMDATRPGWAEDHGPVEMILAVNLLHLISKREAETLLSEIARALAPGGAGFLYGPFLRDGATTSAGDAQFHASLQAQDAQIGYKDLAWVIDRLSPLVVTAQEMPANNLMLIARLADRRG